MKLEVAQVIKLRKGVEPLQSLSYDFGFNLLFQDLDQRRQTTMQLGYRVQGLGT